MDPHLVFVVGVVDHPREQVIGGRLRNARDPHGRCAYDRAHQAHRHHVHLLIVAPESARTPANAAFNATG
jgi:hypothetical protein